MTRNLCESRSAGFDRISRNHTNSSRNASAAWTLVGELSSPSSVCIARKSPSLSMSIVPVGTDGFLQDNLRSDLESEVQKYNSNANKIEQLLAANNCENWSIGASVGVPSDKEVKWKAHNSESRDLDLLQLFYCRASTVLLMAAFRALFSPMRRCRHDRSELAISVEFALRKSSSLL